MRFQCVRIYRFRRGSLFRVVTSVRLNLIPQLRKEPGFVRFRFITTADDRAVSESVWETEAQAASADVVEADWVRASISDELDGLPDLLIGPIEVDTASD